MSLTFLTNNWISQISLLASLTLLLNYILRLQIILALVLLSLKKGDTHSPFLIFIISLSLSFSLLLSIMLVLVFLLLWFFQSLWVVVKMQQRFCYYCFYSFPSLLIVYIISCSFLLCVEISKMCLDTGE